MRIFNCTKITNWGLRGGEKSPQFYIQPWVKRWSLGVWENTSGLARVENNTLWPDTSVAETADKPQTTMVVVTSVRIPFSRRTEEKPKSGGHLAGRAVTFPGTRLWLATNQRTAREWDPRQYSACAQQWVPKGCQSMCLSICEQRT